MMMMGKYVCLRVQGPSIFLNLYLFQVYFHYGSHGFKGSGHIRTGTSLPVCMRYLKLFRNPVILQQ